MIPSTAQLSVEMSRVDYQQGEKNRWMKSRDKAYNYYKGRTPVQPTGMYINKAYMEK